MVKCTDCTGSCKFNYYAITTTTAPYLIHISAVCKCIYNDQYYLFLMLGDKRAQEAMKNALIDVNKKIAHKLKITKVEKRTKEANQNALVHAT